MRKYTPTRFWAKTVPTRGCLEWSGFRSPTGYGRLLWGGRLQLAHRVAWQLIHGPIPDGLQVLHRCDNPPCVNPAHLWLGTQLDNIRDRDAKGRTKRGPQKRAAA